MTADPMTPALAARPATPAQLSWLSTEVRCWQAEGLLADDQAAQILHRYVTTRRFSLARLLLGIGGSFFGVGLIWLVAANLDALPPMGRLAAVALIWLGLLAGGEALDAGRRSPALSGSIRLVAALAFGALVFQAAQSLQVPAYEPRLVGLWGAGALAHAYAVRSRGPLLVGLAAGTGWFVWQLVAEAPSVLAGVLGLAIAAVVASAVSTLHQEDDFAAPWRILAALLGLSALFTAALPFVDAGDSAWSATLVAGLAVAALAAAAAWMRTTGTARLEPLGAIGVLLASVALVFWDTGTDASDLGVAEWTHALVSVAAYVVLAVAVAALGVLRDSNTLTALAAFGLVVFTTVQSFAVFAVVLQGSLLFLVLGLVFVATGYLFDRARRELAASLDGEVR